MNNAQQFADWYAQKLNATADNWSFIPNQRSARQKPEEIQLNTRVDRSPPSRLILDRLIGDGAAAFVGIFEDGARTNVLKPEQALSAFKFTSGPCLVDRLVPLRRLVTGSRFKINFSP